jgi:hypothetical protein
MSVRFKDKNDAVQDHAEKHHNSKRRINPQDEKFVLSKRDELINPLKPKSAISFSPKIRF